MSKRIGRTFDAVIYPKKYKPFPGITNPQHFALAWKHKPMWVFSNMSHAAYCDESDMRTLFNNFGAKTYFYESKPDKRGIIRGRQALLAVWPDKAILSFRGTESTEQRKIKTHPYFLKIANLIGIKCADEISLWLATDVIDDIKFFKKDYKGAKVHRGFLSATTELWPDIEKDLNSLNLSRPDEIYTCGHSLGAAMAVIAAMNYPFKKLITFGEPRVGKNITNAVADTIPHIRYVNGYDPVTKIVPSFWPFSYKHHGKLVYIEDSDYGGPDARYDHSIINYSEVLSEDPLKLFTGFK